MRRNWTILALVALLFAPALACQTVMGALSQNPTPTFEPVGPELGTLAPPDLGTALPEGTLPALPPIDLGGDVPDDIPIDSNAANVSASGGTIAYTTSTAFDDVVAFYEEQMPLNGWAKAEGSLTFGEIAALNYSKDGRSAVVSVTKSGNEVVVGIVVH